MNERIDLRIPTPTLKRWRATAAVEGLSLSEWIRQCCDAHAVDQDTIDVVTKKLAEQRASKPKKGKR